MSFQGGGSNCFVSANEGLEIVFLRVNRYGKYSQDYENRDCYFWVDQFRDTPESMVDRVKGKAIWCFCFGSSF